MFSIISTRIFPALLKEAPMINAIYVNLPIHDVNKTRAFWSALGFTFNEQFSDEKAVCLELNPPSIYAMLIHNDYFATFTDKPVSDRQSSQVLLAIELASKEDVLRMVETAVQNGARRYLEPQDHGWMYYERFEDIDGHQWEIMSMTPVSEESQS